MIFAENRKVRIKYEILEKYEAGIELLGLEVKSLRKGGASLDGSHIIIRGGEAFMINANIPPYQPGNTVPDYDPRRTRKILLTKKELKQLFGRTEEGGLTLVPLIMYSKGNKVKVSVGLGKGLKKYDKREIIKKRESDRDIARSLMN